MNDTDYMSIALKLAEKGCGKVSPNPMVGAVIVKEGRIIGQGSHLCFGGPHAERNALASLTESPRGATLYVTLEPCPMCAGAIVQARIPAVVIGCMNPKAGCAGSVLDMLHEEGFNHQVETRIGILGETCSAMLSDFFRNLRKKKAEQKAQQIMDGGKPADIAGKP